MRVSSDVALDRAALPFGIMIKHPVPCIHSVRADRQTDWQAVEPSLRIIVGSVILKRNAPTTERWAYADLGSPLALCRGIVSGNVAS